MLFVYNLKYLVHDINSILARPDFHLWLSVARNRLKE